MDLVQLRQKVRQYRQSIGKSQEDLAAALGLAPVTLSNKLNASNKLSLSRIEIKKIVKVLAEWDAITSQHQVLELLELTDCRPHDFTEEEWESYPLNKLEVSSPLPKKLVKGLNFPGSSLTTLPIQLTSFVGRQREIARLKAWLSESKKPGRLVTLTGTGGIGKTRLALQVMSELKGPGEFEVWLVELDSLTDQTLVPQAIARAIGVEEQAGIPILTSLFEQLKSRTGLLLLDNCEHLIIAIAEIARQILDKSPGIKIMATSREPLGIPGELIFAVPALPLPLAKVDFLTVEDLFEYEAIRLFIERATDINPAFRLTEQNAATLLKVSQLLEGLPLAIELAASRVQVLSLEQLEQRLGGYFELLKSLRPTRVARHNTLQSLIDWSYSLLAEKERLLWRRLSVFSGNWSLEAAEAVCGWEPICEKEVLDLLTGLINKSLVVVIEVPAQKPGQISYRLLEPVRQFGLEKLQVANEDGQLKDRHLGYYLRLAEELAPKLRASDQLFAFYWLKEAYDNLRLALDWSSRPGTAPKLVESGLKLAAALSFYWLKGGYHSEARWHYQVLLAAGRLMELEHTLAFGHLLALAGEMAQEQGDFKVARPLLEEALGCLQDCGDKSSLSHAYSVFGIVNAKEGHWEVAKLLFLKTLDLQRELEHKASIAYTLNNLANISMYHSDLSTASLYLEESLQIRRVLGDRLGICQTLNNLGGVYYYKGDYPAAQLSWLEAVSLQREMVDKIILSNTLDNLGVVGIYLGNYDQAREYQQESLSIRQEMGDKNGSGTSFANMGLLALFQKDYGQAQSLLNQSLFIRKEIGDKPGIASCLSNLALVALGLKDSGTAGKLVKDSLSIRQKMGDKAGVAENLAVLAHIVLNQLSQYPVGSKGKLEQQALAVRLLGAVSHTLETTGRVLDFLPGRLYLQTLDEVRLIFHQERFAELFQQGSEIEIEKLILSNL